jgi:hypothetical protein
VPTAIASTSPAQNRACLHTRTEDDKPGLLKKIRIHIKYPDNYKKIKKTDGYLLLMENFFALKMFSPVTTNSYLDKYVMFITEKVSYFGTTANNPYKYNRASERKFLSFLLDKQKHQFSTVHTEEAEKLLNYIDSLGKDLEKQIKHYNKRCAAFEKNNMKLNHLERSRASDYILQIESRANEMARTGNVTFYYGR